MMDQEMVRTAFGALLERLAYFLPNLALAALLVFLGWLFGRLLRSAARGFLKRVGLDRAAESTGLQERLRAARLDTELSDILGRVVFWLVFLVFLALAIQRLGVDLSVLPVDRALFYLPRVFGAILLLVLGTLVAQIVGRAAEAGSAGMGVHGHRAIGRLVRGLLLVVTLVLTVQQLGFELSLLSGTLSNLIVVLAAGFVLMFALGGRDVARNALAGYYAREYVRVGDTITVDGVTGTVEGIRSLNTEIKSGSESVFVPNSLLIELSIRRQDS